MYRDFLTDNEVRPVQMRNSKLVTVFYKNYQYDPMPVILREISPSKFKKHDVEGPQGITYSFLNKAARDDKGGKQTCGVGLAHDGTLKHSAAPAMD